MDDILSDEEWDEDMLEDERNDDLAHHELGRTLITDTTTESSK